MQQDFFGRVFSSLFFFFSSPQTKIIRKYQELITGEREGDEGAEFVCCSFNHKNVSTAEGEA